MLSCRLGEESEPLNDCCSAGALPVPPLCTVPRLHNQLKPPPHRQAASAPLADSATAKPRAPCSAGTDTKQAM